MIKYLILLVLPVMSMAQECPKLERHSDFTIKEKVISIGTNFKLTSKGKEFAYIDEKIMRFTRSFEIYNKNKKLVAKANKRLISWGSVVDVYDCNNQKIGSIEEKVVESLFSIKTKYSVKDDKGQIKGQSEMMSFDVSRLEVKQFNKTVLSMKRGFVQMFGDTWKVKLDSDSNIPTSLLVLIPAYKTASDNNRE